MKALEKIKTQSAVAATLIVFLLLTNGAHGQPSEPAPASVRVTPQLALAMVTVSEEGWLTCEDDACEDAGMRALHAVLLAGAERSSVSYVRFASLYARGLIGRQRMIQRPWLWGLHPDGREPEHWPEHVWRSGERRAHPRWTSYRDRWLRTYEHARDVSQLRMESWEEWAPCDRVPTDWGGTVDMERARRLNMLPLECPGTRNTFYIRRSLVSDDEG